MSSCCPTVDKPAATTSITYTQRSCTDIIFLVLFFVSWLALIVLLFAAAHIQGNDQGNWQRVVKGVDYAGHICGISSGYEDKKFAAMAEYNFEMVLKDPDSLLEAFKIKHCVASCDETYNGKNKLFSDLYKSEAFLSYCIPIFAQNVSVSVSVTADYASPKLVEASEIVVQGIGDIFIARDILYCCIPYALLVTLFFCWLMRKFATCLVYSLLFSVMIIGLFLVHLLLEYADEINTTQLEKERAQWLKYTAYILSAIIGIFAIICFFMRNQIDIAVEVVKESSRALMDMKGLLVFPLLPMAIGVAYVLFWSFCMFHFYSIAKPTNKPRPDWLSTKYQKSWDRVDKTLFDTDNDNVPKEYKEYDERTDETYAYLAFTVFHLLWVLQFLFYFAYLVFAGAAADWYFTKIDNFKEKVRGDKDDELSHTPVCKSCKRTCRYHMGSVAVTSLIIAIVQFLRLTIHYLERTTKGDPMNGAQKALFCAIKCCLAWLECCLDKLNKDALVWTAIYGDNYFVSACSTFNLVWRNLFRVAALHAVSDIVFTMGKIAVMFITAATVSCILLFSKDFGYFEVSSPLGPAVVSLLIAYIISDLFFEIFQGLVDTIFLCFLIDSEVNKDGNMMATPKLQKLVNKYDKTSQDEAKDLRKTRSVRNNMHGSMPFHEDVEMKTQGQA